jgi:dihydrolipoamide dehydrogenase
MPSKALLRSVHALRAARRLPGAREAADGDLDVAAVLARRDSFTSHGSDKGQVQWLEGAGVALVRGRGRLTGERTVTVQGSDGDTVELTARHAVVLATGTAATVPPVPGLREAQPWTSREATTAKDAPRRLVVLGGGVVGLEMAQAWNALGSEQVTVLEHGDRLLPRVEAFAGELVADALREDGIDLRLGATVVRVERPHPSGEVLVHLADGGVVTGDELLVAAGRRPATRDLGLETVGLEPGRPVPVDDSLRVDGTDWLYAVGDVNGRVLLTHQGKYQGRVAADAVLARAAREVPALPRRGRRGRRAAGRVHRPGGGRGRPQQRRRLATGLRVALVEHDIGATAAGRCRPRLPRPGRARGRRGRTGGRRRDLRRSGRRRDGARGDHRGRRAVPLERPAARGPSFPTMSEVWLRCSRSSGSDGRRDLQPGDAFPTSSCPTTTAPRAAQRAGRG